tara:strand:- start:14 stop:664 length:651 start_codon:yes stop_codon:yes gene_type:complete
MNKNIRYDLIGNDWFDRNIKNLETDYKSFPLKYLINWLKEQNFPPNEKLLELGCGPGFSLDFLSKSLQANSFGLDASEFSVSYANRHFPHLKISQGTAGDLSKFEDNSFALIHLGFFMYFLDDNSVKDVVSECERVLKDGGFLSILDFDVQSEEIKIDKHDKNVKIYKRDQGRAFRENFVQLNKRSFTSLLKAKLDVNEERISLQLMLKTNEVKRK